MQEFTLGNEKSSHSFDDDEFRKYLNEKLTFILTNIEQTIEYYQIMLLNHNSNLKKPQQKKVHHKYL